MCLIKNTLIIIINALVFSKLFYCLLVWSNAATTYLVKLQAVRNIAASVIRNARTFDRVTPGLKELAASYSLWAREPKLAIWYHSGVHRLMYIKIFLDIPSLYFWVIVMYPVQLGGVRGAPPPPPPPPPRHFPRLDFSIQYHHTIQFIIELRHVVDNGQKALVWATYIIIRHYNKCELTYLWSVFSHVTYNWIKVLLSLLILTLCAVNVSSQSKDYCCHLKWLVSTRSVIKLGHHKNSCFSVISISRERENKQRFQT